EIFVLEIFVELVEVAIELGREAREVVARLFELRILRRHHLRLRDASGAVRRGIRLQREDVGERLASGRTGLRDEREVLLPRREDRRRDRVEALDVLVELLGELLVRVVLRGSAAAAARA